MKAAFSVDSARIKTSTSIYGCIWVGKSMFVKFVSGDVYRLDKVPYSEYLKLIGAESVGSMYSKEFRNKYETTLVHKAKREKK